MTIETTLRSRRAMLGAGLGALAATVGGALGGSHSATATHLGDVQLGHYNAAAAETTIKNTANHGNALVGIGTGLGAGFWGQSDYGEGVLGESDSAPGVIGSSESDNGVYGHSNAPLGSGVYGANNSDGYGVAGRTASPLRAATLGDNTGSGPGVLGESAAGTGVVGVSHGIGAIAVKGQSDLGRGGQFSGKKAQLRLQPSTDATHPASGAKGDLFVDASGRLWFCKGATTWRQIA